MITLFFLLIAITAVIVELCMAGGWVLAGFLYRKEKNTSYEPTVCVIVPCKGAGKNFKENIQAIINQKYKKFRVIFVTDSNKDMAYILIKEEFANNKRISVVVSKFIEGSSGKISALIKGVKSAGNPEVYVFADSDIKPQDTWLKNLVMHLKDERIGATTGYRWYFPKNSGSIFLSALNMACSLSLFFNISNFTWGGSTAIRKEVFDKIGVINKWKKGYSDDLILTNTLRENRYKIKFVPKCVVESPSEGDFRYIFKWQTQQFTWIKWYYSFYWILSIIGITALKISTISGFILFAYGYVLPGLLMISTIFIEMLYGGFSHHAYKNLMNYPKKRFSSSIIYALLMPVIFFIFAYTNIASAFKTEIKWGGRTYKKPI